MARAKSTRRKGPRQTSTAGASTTESLGQAVLDCLHAILKRCKEAGVRLDFPGEGGERSFRGWLVTDLITEVLGWPAGKVVVGERFDILLQDADGFPVVTIETKSPYHKASKKERKVFEERLSAYGTLRTAYFTNGAEWVRLDIFAPGGDLEIRDRFTLQLKAASPEEAEGFFAPLFANRHFTETTRSSRHVVRRENPHILEALAADLHQAIGDLAFFFRSLFSGLRDGKAGEKSRSVTLTLFSLWCDKSLIVSPPEAAEQLADRFKKKDLGPREVVKALSDLGLTDTGADKAAEELLSLSKPKRQNADAVGEAIWPAYEQAFNKLCAQTAHVVVARALLYRVGEDQSAFPRTLSGNLLEEALSAPKTGVLEAPPPATDLLSRSRISMENFLPTVYKLGEFDWWLVTPEKRAALNKSERSWLRDRDAELEHSAQRLLRMLNGYFFGKVDVDVWRNVYQHYLPPEERQRIGGFYTPDELVHLILDLSEYKSKEEGLCQLSVIDPACGSGAFITGALGRLVEHFELALPCHTELHKRGMPEWKHAEQILRIVADRLHAVDLHPFAAFLTTLNVLFLLLPLYVKAREKNRDFTLDFNIFSADSLEKHDTDLLKPDLFARLNSRVQLTEDSFHRYQEMLKKRFDRVFGNPPWGGVLKGRLAPVYATIKKERFASEYPAAAQGKYDVYGLFMERALEILKPGGRFGLLTQGSFIDKEWARGLRELLTTKSCPRYIIDLNPFGQLFFHAMNTPCITVADVLGNGDGKCECVGVISTPPKDFKGLSEEERRNRVKSTIRAVVEQVSQNRKSVVVDFARAARVSVERLRETAKDRWNLAGQSATVELPKDWSTAAGLLEMRQGVTPGGCLDVFLMSKEKAQQLEIEKVLIQRAIKSKKVRRWHVDWAGQVLFYPYHITDEGAVPVFTINLEEIRDSKLAETIRRVGLKDALDFDKQLDSHELEIVRRRGVNRSSVRDLLRHHIALDLVHYKKAAQYLAEHYERLAGREFEKKRFTAMGKRWYEYHRPRDPEIMLSKRRIVSPTLMKQVRFALDTVGYLSDHACLYLQPTGKTRRSWSTLRKQLAEALRRDVSDEDSLKYCLAFLNSAYAQECLTTGHRPTPKGSYAITEGYLKEIPIPPPTNKRTAAAILDLVGKLVATADVRKTARLEADLAKVVDPILRL